jgi:DNA-binding transcriptional regulator YhcF (GntR family)
MANETENLFTGYIKIFRSIRKHWIWEDQRKLKWWLDMLLEANHTDRKVGIGFQLIECRRGQTLLSMQNWSERWRVDVSTVRRFMELLKNDDMIVTENVQKTTRITICNYDSYNGDQPEKQFKSNSKAKSTQIGHNTNNNDKNDKETIEGGMDQIAFDKFQGWLQKHGPRVMQMKCPFTLSDFIELKAYPKEVVTEIIEAMHNYKPLLTKNVSAILTFKNWADRRKKTSGNGTIHAETGAPPLKIV